MAEEFMIGIAAIWAALALGLIPAMTLFIGRVAFQTLDEENAAKFLRVAFKTYYLMLACFAGFATVLLAIPRPIEAAMMASVAGLALFARYWLLPIAHNLDDLRIQRLSGVPVEEQTSIKTTTLTERLGVGAAGAIKGLADEIGIDAEADYRTDPDVQRALITVQSRSSFIAIAQIGACIAVVVRLAIV